MKWLSVALLLFSNLVLADEIEAMCVHHSTMIAVAARELGQGADWHSASEVAAAIARPAPNTEYEHYLHLAISQHTAEDIRLFQRSYYIAANYWAGRMHREDMLPLEEFISESVASCIGWSFRESLDIYLREYILLVQESD